MVRALYVITLLSTTAGALLFFFGFLGTKSAPQEASAAAGAIALAVIPYVFTRCVQLSNDYAQRRETDKRLISLLEDSNTIAQRRAET